MTTFQLSLIIRTKTAGFSVNGSIIIPEIINLDPAKWKGVSNLNPILIPA